MLPHVRGIKGLLALALVLAGFAPGCATDNPYVENRRVLESSQNSLKQENYQAAAQQAEELFAGRAEQDSEYKLQRYYASVLCAQAHVQAALHRPFLTQAPADAGQGISAAADAPLAGAVGSPTSHWVAATYYAGFSKDSFADAAKSPQKIDDEELLPPALKKVSIERMQEGLNLTRLAVLRLLGFEDECAATLESSPEMLDVAKCMERIENAELPKELRPLVFYAGFQYMNRKLRVNPNVMSSQATAYKLGAQARVLAAEFPDTPYTAFTRDVIAWVDGNKFFEFHCQCNKKFPSTLLRCPVCTTRIDNVIVREKAPDPR